MPKYCWTIAYVETKDYLNIQHNEVTNTIRNQQIGTNNNHIWDTYKQVNDDITNWKLSKYVNIPCKVNEQGQVISYKLPWGYVKQENNKEVLLDNPIQLKNNHLKKVLNYFKKQELKINNKIPENPNKKLTKTEKLAFKSPFFKGKLKGANMPKHCWTIAYVEPKDYLNIQHNEVTNTIRNQQIGTNNNHIWDTYKQVNDDITNWKLSKYVNIPCKVNEQGQVISYKLPWGYVKQENNKEVLLDNPIQLKNNHLKKVLNYFKKQELKINNKIPENPNKKSKP
jgi:hypothetical protein